MMLLALLAAAASPAAERLTYRMGGLMSTPIDLDLDLVTGTFSLKEGQPDAATQPLSDRHGRLDAATLAGIRRLAAQGVVSGFETTDCRRRAARGEIIMPIMDAMPSMAVSIGGRWVAAPVNIGCWTSAANDLAGASYEAAHRAASPDGG